MKSAVHHHGESETAIYVIGGRARFVSGDNLGDMTPSERLAAAMQ